MNSATAPHQNDGNLPPLVYRPCARIYRPSFRENERFWACFRENQVFNSGTGSVSEFADSEYRSTSSEYGGSIQIRIGNHGEGVSPNLYVMDPNPTPRFTEVGKSEEIF